MPSSETQRIDPPSLNINNIITENNIFFIKPIIIITSTENIYYWKKKLILDDYKDLLILLLLSNINNKIDINKYDIIIIKGNLFEQFLTTLYKGNLYEIVYNILIFDDLQYLKQTFINKYFYNLYNCLNIIIIDRKITLKSLLKNNIDINTYYLQMYNYYIKDFNIPFILLLDNTASIPYNSLKLTETEYTYHSTNNILIIETNNYELDVKNIKKIINYYINDNLPFDFIQNIIKTVLNNYDNNDENFILRVMYEINYILNEYEYLNSKIKKIKNELTEEIMFIKTNMNNKLINDIKITTLEKNININLYNDYFNSSTIIKNIYDLINNIVKKDINFKDNINLIIDDYIRIYNNIDDILLFIEITLQKLTKYVIFFKENISQSIINNSCSYCKKKLIKHKNIIQTCCYCLICEECVKLYITTCICCKKDIFNLLYINYNNLLYDKKIHNNIIKSNKKNINVLVDLIKSIIKKNQQYKIIIILPKTYYNNINNILIFNDLNVKNNIDETVLDNLENENKSIILLLLDTNILSLNYEKITNIIFFIDDSEIKKNINDKHKFYEIERFNIGTDKEFYYIL